MLEKAIQWIKNNSLPGQGIVVSSRKRVSYPEVTGYFIPTLLSIGEHDLAYQYARWLLTVQRQDGSYGLNGHSYAFDTGQVVRGWVALLEQMPELEQPLCRACDWLIETADSQTGRLMVPPLGAAWSLGRRGQVSESIHLYVLPPLYRAGELLNESRYCEFVSRSLNYYLKNVNLTDFSQPNALTHFYAYTQEALLELGCEDKARRGMASVAGFQQPTGAVPGYSDVNWVCSTGLAQLAQVWYRLGETERANAALKFLEMVQNPSGGFLGSYGVGADYFPTEEISWACKYAIEAAQQQIAGHFNQTVDIYKADISETDGRVQAVSSHLGDLNGKRVLDAGCGKGRFSAIIKRRYPQADVTALDISDQMLRYVPPGIRTVKGGILDMPFEESWFDAVICIEALEHAVQIAEGVKELTRVLAPGGKLIIIDKNKDKLGALEMPGWEKWFDREELLGMMQANGLKADAEFIGYEKVTRPDGLFICWSGQKPALQTNVSTLAVGLNRKTRRLAVVPSDPLSAYAHKSNEYLTNYFNPMGLFHEVYCLSPLEKSEGFRHGMHVIPTNPEQFAQRIKELKIDIVRAYGGYWACDMACENKVEGVPVIVSVHDKRKSWLHESIKDADHIIAVSGVVNKLLLDEGVPPERIQVLPNRVDMNIFKPISDDRLEKKFKADYPGKYHILHVGRKSNEKNLDTLIKALRELGPEYTCIFTGKGDITPYQLLAQQNGVSQQCHFIDSIQNSDLVNYYCFCDCMCTPSRSEGFGMVFIEALACEAIVVTSDIAPMNEYITNNQSGILVKNFENPESLAEAIARACTDQELRSVIAANARKAAEPFSKGKIDALEVAVYEKFIEQASKNSTRTRAPALLAVPAKSTARGYGAEHRHKLAVPNTKVHAIARESLTSNAPRSKETTQNSPRFLLLQQMLKSSRKIIDLGCGNKPVSGCVVGVDCNVEPSQRSLGYGAKIDENKFKQRNIRFVNQRIDTKLPFSDKEFDFAYSHHAFEHLEDPATACSEMIRIAKAGAIITPSVFAEMCFGRAYHRWLVIDRANTLFFLEKRKVEDRPFGDHPEWTEEKGWQSTEKTNPFDMVLNESGWYHESPCNALERLRGKLRQLWFSHSPVIEVVFLWQNSFTYTVLREQPAYDECTKTCAPANP